MEQLDTVWGGEAQLAKMENGFADALGQQVLGAVKDYFIFATAAFILFYVILRGAMKRRKIQSRFPSASDYMRDVLFSLSTIAIFGFVSAMTFHVAWDQTNLYTGSFDQYGLLYYVFTLVWMVFLHDAYFYWVHRLMHTEFLYRHVHKIHHRSNNPSPWTAYAFHPLEAFIEAGIVPLIAFTLPVHVSAVAVFFLFQITYNVYGHLGYELYPRGFHKTRIGRYVNTSVAHNLHHSRFTGNYGLYFLIWDRLMGTLRQDYNETYEATTERA